MGGDARERVVERGAGSGAKGARLHHLREHNVARLRTRGGEERAQTKPRAGENERLQEEKGKAALDEGLGQNARRPREDAAARSHPTRLARVILQVLRAWGP